MLFHIICKIFSNDWFVSFCQETKFREGYSPSVLSSSYPITSEFTYFNSLFAIFYYINNHSLYNHLLPLTLHSKYFWLLNNQYELPACPLVQLRGSLCSLWINSRWVKHFFIDASFQTSSSKQMFFIKVSYNKPIAQLFVFWLL